MKISKNISLCYVPINVCLTSPTDAEFLKPRHGIKKGGDHLALMGYIDGGEKL